MDAAKLTPEQIADQEAYEDLLADDYRDDPVLHETRWGEGWTHAHFRQMFIDAGYDLIDPNRLE